MIVIILVGMDEVRNEVLNEVRNEVCLYYKTRVCSKWLENKCCLQNCFDTHGPLPLRRVPCLINNEWNYGVSRCTTPGCHCHSCKCAHSVFEVMFHPLVYKTKLCDDFNCQRQHCARAHGTSELRTIGRVHQMDIAPKLPSARILKPTKIIRSTSTFSEYSPSRQEMLHMFKIRPCSKSHRCEWVQCPFYHHKNDYRRYPFQGNRLVYYPKQCSLEDCTQGPFCTQAHNIVETQFHPFVYKTTMCRTENCGRQFCAFAHTQEEMRQSIETKIKLRLELQ